MRNTRGSSRKLPEPTRSGSTGSAGPPSGSRIVYGAHPVEEALSRRDRQVQELLVTSDRRLEPLVASAAARKVRVQRVAADELTAICGSTSHQGVAAVVGEFGYVDLEELLPPEVSEVPLLLLVDGVTDPQNLGAMIRSALVLGGTGVVLPKDRCAGITPTVVRVSSGATEHLPCAQVTNLSRAIGQLKEAGIWVAGTVERGGVPPEEADLAGPVALVLGNEHRGLRPLVQRACDFSITIPTDAAIASLNVASATAVLFAEAARQRRAGPA